MSSIRSYLRGVLPCGIVEWLKRRRELERLGYEGKIWSVQSVNRAYWAAHRAGLDLFPDQVLPNLHTLIDVGANRGQWLANALECTSPERISVIEPGPSAYRKLLNKFGSEERISLHNVIAGAEEGKSKFRITRSDDLSSAVKPTDEFQSNIGDNACIDSVIEKKIEKVDKIASEYRKVSLMKIDVQGLEMEVLRGGQETLKITDFILIEFNYYEKYEGAGDFTEVHRFLSERGFVLIDMSKPAKLEGRASFSDALYKNKNNNF